MLESWQSKRLIDYMFTCTIIPKLCLNAYYYWWCHHYLTAHSSHHKALIDHHYRQHIYHHTCTCTSYIPYMYFIRNRVKSNFDRQPNHLFSHSEITSHAIFSPVILILQQHQWLTPLHMHALRNTRRSKVICRTVAWKEGVKYFNWLLSLVDKLRR